ncbi:hypothetical protein D9611_010127 [Ephemerocybe angulata]|uniref:BTB domain-containing protein n=1 Tax=Ephemerocybe angulata TaxID=980116 RepID=A0A8H5B0D3_9AGAR|nr:hypothetical protein D9611_010127 [Tulosesus angulatus]
MPTRDPDLYCVFQVEDTLFRVPRHRLDQASDVFANKFRPQTAEEGQSDDNPIVIEGCTSSEFESLLKYMLLPMEHLPGPVVTAIATTNISKKEWLDILKLSTAWKMDAVRLQTFAGLGVDPMLSQTS